MNWRVRLLGLHIIFIVVMIFASTMDNTGVVEVIQKPKARPTPPQNPPPHPKINQWGTPFFDASPTENSGCVHMNLRASRTRHALYCPFSINMGLTNQMMMFAQCVLSAWRYAGGADVYFEHNLQLGTIYDVYNIAAFAKFVKHYLDVRVYVACPGPVDPAMPYTTWIKNMSPALRVIHGPKTIRIVPNAFSINFFNRPALLPFVNFIVEHPSAKIVELTQQILSAPDAPFELGAHARIEGDVLALIGQRKGMKGIRSYNYTLTLFLGPLKETLVGNSTTDTATLYVSGLEARGYRPFPWVVPKCKDDFLDPSDVARYINTTTHYLTLKTGVAPCTVNSAWCVPLTNTTAAMVDFIVLLQSRRTLSAYFSSFGSMLYHIRCARGLSNRTAAYSRQFRVEYQGDCSMLSPMTLNPSDVLPLISSLEYYHPNRQPRARERNRAVTENI